MEDGELKLKSDFVTNSSSTSYLTYIPDDFKVEKFRELIKNMSTESIEDNLEEYEYDYNLPDGKKLIKTRTEDDDHR